MVSVVEGPRRGGGVGGWRGGRGWGAGGPTNSPMAGSEDAEMAGTTTTDRSINYSAGGCFL